MLKYRTWNFVLAASVVCLMSGCNGLIGLLAQTTPRPAIPPLENSFEHVSQKAAAAPATTATPPPVAVPPAKTGWVFTEAEFDAKLAPQMSALNDLKKTTADDATADDVAAVKRAVDAIAATSADWLAALGSMKYSVDAAVSTVNGVDQKVTDMATDVARIRAIVEATALRVEIAPAPPRVPAPRASAAPPPIEQTTEPLPPVPDDRTPAQVIEDLEAQLRQMEAELSAARVLIVPAPAGTYRYREKSKTVEKSRAPSSSYSGIVVTHYGAAIDPIAFINRWYNGTDYTVNGMTIEKHLGDHGFYGSGISRLTVRQKYRLHSAAHIWERAGRPSQTIVTVAPAATVGVPAPPAPPTYVVNPPSYSSSGCPNGKCAVGTSRRVERRRFRVETKYW